MTPIIDVISLGIGELGEEATLLLQNSAVVIGSERQLVLVQALCPRARKLILPSPISDLENMIQGLEQSPVAVLASGDALFYGIGSLLIKLRGRDRLRFHPNISSMQYCMHLIGQPWQDAIICSLHGRPGSSLRRYLASNSLLGIFTDQSNHPIAVAKELVSQSLVDATVWVGEGLGTPEQKLSRFSADELALSQLVFDPLNVVVVKTGSAPPALPAFPGIADHLFATGAEPGFGMISKREVRLAILSMMQPAPGQTAWDIGAGCGSVSVEWARWNPQGMIYAVELEPERIAHIQTNTARFGVEQNCCITRGSAPGICDTLPDPDTVFIGGNNGNLQQLIDYSWARLKTGGVLVASAVTVTSQSVLAACAEAHRRKGNAVEWSEITVRKNLPDSAEVRALSPVQLLRCKKS